MSSSSSNLSKRIFMTVVHNDNTAYIGLLEDSMQKKLVRFTEEELVNLTKMLVQLKDDIIYEEEE